MAAAAAAAAAHVTSRQANASISCSLFLSFSTLILTGRLVKGAYTKQRKKQIACQSIWAVFNGSSSSTTSQFSTTQSLFERFRELQAQAGLTVRFTVVTVVQLFIYLFAYSNQKGRRRRKKREILLKCFTFFVCLFTLHQRGLLPKPFLLFFLL